MKKREMEIKETIPLTFEMKRVKYLGTNLPKETNYLCIENYKALLKEINDTNGWRNIPRSWIERTNMVKISILYKAIYRFSTITIKQKMVFFTKLEQIISQLYGNTKVLK